MISIFMFSGKAESFQRVPPPVPATDIIPADDAFHGSEKRKSAEWWYFDATFTNNYSLHVGVRTFSKKNKGRVTLFLEFYKEGKLVEKASKKFPFSEFKTSQNLPYVEIDNNTIVKFDEKRFKEKGVWAYDIELGLENHKVNLKFIGTTQGFKFETKAESWTVAIPKATVNGEVTISGKKINVEGIGYHDHNWNYSLLTPFTYGKGWFWGKIMSDSLTVSWAEVIKSANKGEILAVFNQDNKGYLSAKAENIFFTADKFIKNKRRKMPTFFTVKIDDEVNGKKIKTDVKMEVKEFHFDKVMIIAPYWRFHVRAEGYISIGSKKEKVNEIQIMEYLKFS
jgi:predicted secreted hydrolase